MRWLDWREHETLCGALAQVAAQRAGTRRARKLRVNLAILRSSLAAISHAEQDLIKKYFWDSKEVYELDTSIGPNSLREGRRRLSAALHNLYDVYVAESVPVRTKVVSND